MGNDWTRLTQEAGESGGPDDLRGHYRTKGRVEATAGILTLTLAGAGLKWAIDRLRSRDGKAESGEEAVEQTRDEVSQTRPARCSP
ncbi:hypothetical protein GCM10010415_10750 [Streptomyces atrovirens]